MKTIRKSATLESIDPILAWETWEPSSDEPWDLARVSLLHRRAGFGATETELTKSLSIAPREIIDQLSGKSTTEANQDFEAESAEIAQAVLGSAAMPRLAAWWLHRMLQSPNQLVEKMTLFWHGHFATGAEKVMDVELMYAQNQLLRQESLGTFQKLVQRIAKDPAMLIYLDSVSNRKAHANENFARELMELFCLGEGNYSETDVQQLAKCFTGWEIRRSQFRFNPFQHDDSMKSLLGVSNIESGEAAIDCVLSSPYMPLFIVRKLFRFFISEDISPSDAFLKPLADTFVASHFSIEAVVRQILESRLMLSGWSIGRKIRSPIELIVGWMRTMQCTANLPFVTDRMRSLGQSLLFPPNVKGWEGGRHWINSSTLISRANLLFDLTRHENSRFDSKTFQVFTDRSEFANWFGTYFLATPLSDAEKTSLLSAQASERSGHAGSDFMIAVAKSPRIHLS